MLFIIPYSDVGCDLVHRLITVSCQSAPPLITSNDEMHVWNGVSVQACYYYKYVFLFCCGVVFNTGADSLIKGNRAKTQRENLNPVSYWKEPIALTFNLSRSEGAPSQ